MANNQVKLIVRSSKDDERSFNNGIPKPRSCNNNSRRNPCSFHGRQLSGYQLEDKFCRMVGGVSWKYIKENQKYNYQHDKIIKWEDSAVEEAYWDAKTRFLAKEVHGEPYDDDVQLPDPDIFIDKIDWDSSSSSSAAVDPRLLSDLDNEAVVKQDDIGGVIIDIPPTVIASDLTPNGWGDAQHVNPPQHQVCWDDNNNNNNNLVKTEHHQGFENYVDATQDTRLDQENRINGNSYRKQQQGYYYENENEKSTSRYKISRYHQQNNNRRSFDNFGGRKGNSLMAWKPVTRCQ